MSGGSRKLAVLFLAVVVPSAATLVWLGWQLLERDRDQWARNEAERRNAEADEVVRVLDAALTAALDRSNTDPNAVVFPAWPSRAGTSGRILWRPQTYAPMQATPVMFVEAEALESRDRAPEALVVYEELTHSADATTRAGAWQRVARVHLRNHAWDAALTAYSELATIERVELSGMPVSLLSRRAACDVLDAAGRTKELAKAAATLETDFLRGAWDIDRSAWELTSHDIEGWLGRPPAIPHQARMLTAAADMLAARDSRPVNADERRHLLDVEGVHVTVVERLNAGRHHVTLLLPEAVSRWLANVRVDGSVNLLTAGGASVTGSHRRAGATVVERTVDRLPWTVSVATDPNRGMQEFTAKRRLLAWGLLVIVLLLAGGSYLLWRLVQQELAVARLQTEFVAAVSHEFRTPLASLRHVTELLEEDDALPGGERRRFYAVIGRNTERLSRLVESLLDFARMESGRKPYELRYVDARAIAEDLVRDFRAEVHPRGFTVETRIDTGELGVNADADSLSHALWNLLDNAVKYSGDEHVVVLSVQARGDQVVFAVADRGLGIPQSERVEIFGRFVRGAKARELGIKGTGLGLAMVAHIVAAHRGTVEVESREGAGSTFRVVLPAV